MTLLASQLELSKEEKEGLRTVSYFTVSAYIEAWFSAPDVASAARSDLQLVANIQRFRAFHPVAAEAAAQKFGNHL